MVNLPGDKSISHRAAILAAIADGESHIENYLVSGVTDAMLQSLSALGVVWELRGSTLIVQGKGLEGIVPPPSPLNCGNSATTLRLLVGLISAAGVPAILDGSPGLRKRPMKRIVDPLRAMGVDIKAEEGHTAPLKIGPRSKSRALKGISYTLPIASAQVKSCILLAGLAADSPVTIIEPGPSRDHTERMFTSLGIEVVTSAGNKTSRNICLYPQLPLRIPPLKITVPGDFSSAAFLIVAALLSPGSDIRILNVGLNPTRTGLLDVLLSMGAQIQVGNLRTSHGEILGDLIIHNSELVSTIVSGSLVVRMIDEFPVLGVAAGIAKGVTIVSDASELRYKESDRISAMCRELRMLGIDIEEKSDGFVVYGNNRIFGGQVDSHNDHRLAMSLTLAGLIAENPVIVHNSEVIAESFPEFIPTMQNLGANLEEDIELA